jgi:aspartate dehydrogenase
MNGYLRWWLYARQRQASRTVRVPPCWHRPTRESLPLKPIPKRLALVGCGAIGSAVLSLLEGDAWARVEQIIVTPRHLEATQRRAPQARVATTLDVSNPPDLLVECAGHGALQAHVLPALRAGIPAVLASVGALHDSALAEALEAAAQATGTRLQLVSGAIGGIDALAAARHGGLAAVRYTGRKPPQGWRGTPAEALCDLAALQAPLTLFEGSAREAARRYPKNANVAATVSLAGLGLDATQVTLVADPSLTRNVHHLVATGAFGRLELTIENEPLAANPKTSALTVFSILRAIHQATRPLAL